MKRLTLIILAVISFSIKNFTFSQEKFQTETEKYIFWQPNRTLKQEDFKANGSKNPIFVRYCEDFDLCAMAAIGVHAVLDIPKKKRKRGKLIEKAYFAPAFEKTMSYLLKEDSMEIAKQKLVFDIYEVSTRLARRELAHLQDSVSGYGIISKMFKTVEAKAVEFRKAMVDSFTKDVYIYKRDGAYLKWRARVDELLVNLNEFATKPEDCYRFVKNIPIDDRYIEAPKVIGNLKK